MVFKVRTPRLAVAALIVVRASIGRAGNDRHQIAIAARALRVYVNNVRRCVYMA